MCILGNMHGCFYGLWSKNNEYRVTIELVQKNSLHKKRKSGKSARTFFGECDQSRGDEQKFMEVKKYHSAVILLGQYVAVQIFLHYSTGNLSEAGPMADCLRQNRIPKSWTGASEY